MLPDVLRGGVQAFGGVVRQSSHPFATGEAIGLLVESGCGCFHTARCRPAVLVYLLGCGLPQIGYFIFDLRRHIGNLVAHGSRRVSRLFKCAFCWHSDLLFTGDDGATGVPMEMYL